ncbi:MAG TPA: bifunctional 2-polyprenyl-6-hydroxyphenol methylase/3-demethylubiquinol 3-O-methyltransferase UbiG [Acetobacteraceae bacterium]|nr:bifunctional 2-polyprenyl-6-hydroxyphenol methylase/3-demethylubiquinol 3-O-methyltransferase UbiG [Acetobacteraceae bacterium]
MEDAAVSPAEIARFDALAGHWWDPNGPMRPLHRMNPLRAGWIAARIARRFPGATPGTIPARVLDVGCGAGLLAEALARRGFSVLGLDAAGAAIAVAREHALGAGVAVEYRIGTADDLLAEGARFPVITALEVIEHVPDPARFVATLAALLAPGGLLFLSTLNRTARSFLLAKLGAEYLLRLLPVGTHEWRRFITPAEMRAHLAAAGLRAEEMAGMSYAPLSGLWRASEDLSVNYILEARLAA